MKALKISREDCELFNSEAGLERHYLFFVSHQDTFKSMWSEQGSTYWLRFLLSFRSSRLNYSLSDETRKVIETGFIYIHKTFIEKDYRAAENLIINFIIIAKTYRLFPGMLFFSNFQESSECKVSIAAFMDVFGIFQESCLSRISSLVVFPMYLGFCEAVCTLFERWVGENDLIFENSHDADNNNSYWMPFSEWTDDGYSPSLFEAYIGNYWEDKLPNMLLTCDIHNIFTTKATLICCKKTDDETVEIKTTVNGRFKSFYKHRCNIAVCKYHLNCRRKIQHTIQCVEPYFCEGGPNCSLTCETLIKNNNKLEMSMEDKHFEFSYFKSKHKNKRHVSTAIQTKENVFIETFLPDKKGKKASAELHLEMNHSERNKFRQRKGVEDTRERLRNTLIKRNKSFELDCNKIRNDAEAFNDKKNRTALVEKTAKKFQKEINLQRASANCEEFNISNQFHQHGSKGISSSLDLEHEKLQDIVHVMNSVAVGTDDLVWGKVYLVSLKTLEKEIKTNEASAGKECDVKKHVSVQKPLEIDEVMEMGIVAKGKGMNKKQNVPMKSNNKWSSNFPSTSKATCLVNEYDSEDGYACSEIKETCLDNDYDYEDGYACSEVNVKNIKQKNSKDLKHKVDLIIKDLCAKTDELINQGTVGLENVKSELEILAEIKRDLNKSQEINDSGDEIIKRNVSVSSKKNKNVADITKTLPCFENLTTKETTQHNDAINVEFFIDKSIKENNDSVGYEEFSHMMETRNMLVGTTEEENKIIDNTRNTNLKICAFCHKKESSRCKAGNLSQHRYYSCREWKALHRGEHLDTIQE